MKTIFEVKDVKMAAITLRNIPDEIHRKLKRIQLDYADVGVKKTLEDVYMELIYLGIEDFEKKKPTK